MPKFKKGYILKIINIVIAGIFILDTASYGRALPPPFSLRVSSMTATEEGVERFNEIEIALSQEQESFSEYDFGKNSVSLYEENVLDTHSEDIFNLLGAKVWEPRELSEFIQDKLAVLCRTVVSETWISHSEKAGGTHFKTILHKELSLVDKTPNSQKVMKSVELAEQRLSGKVINFLVIKDKDGNARIIQDLVPSLKTVLEKMARESDIKGAENLIRKWLSLTTDIIKRGVVDWDAKAENYGVTNDGEVRLIDLGGLITTEEFFDDLEFEDSSLFFFYSKLNENIPSDLRQVFFKISDEFGFGNGTKIVETIKKYANTEEPRYVRWIPQIFRGQLISQINLEIEKRLRKNNLTLEINGAVSGVSEEAIQSRKFLDQAI